MQRMTIPDVLHLAEAQTAGMFKVSDFVPVPCCFPTCNSVTYAYVDGDTVLPLPRVINVEEYLDYISNRVLPDFSMEIRGALETLWSSSAVAGGSKVAEDVTIACEACGIPEAISIDSIKDKIFMIMLQDFMDLWTFNQKNLMKCCKAFLLPDDHQIPFCAYNTVGYREQARAQLTAREHARARARAQGIDYNPVPLAFSFNRDRPQPLFITDGSLTLVDSAAGQAMANAGSQEGSPTP